MTKFRVLSLALLTTSILAIPAVVDANTKHGNMRTSAMSAEQAVAKWSATPKKVAMETIAKYGQPQEVTASMLVWHNNGPWKRTVVYREERTHLFPMAHTDLLEQTIDYRVPPAKHSEIAAFDGSVNIDRTGGEVSARCDKEGANLLALNLAHEIATGKRTVEEARAHYAASIDAMKANRPNEYTQRLLFANMGGGGGMGMKGTADPDQPFKK